MFRSTVAQVEDRSHLDAKFVPGFERARRTSSCLRYYGIRKKGILERNGNANNLGFKGLTSY